MPQYLFVNGAAPTTAAVTPITTGTAIKTLTQVKGVTAVQFKVLAYSFSFDGSAAATPIRCELIETGTVFGTVTAAVAADLPCTSDPNGPTSTTFFSVGTSATGYTATAEGTITASRLLDIPQLVAPTNELIVQFPLGREPVVNAVSALRMRVTATAAVLAYAGLLMEV